MGVFARIMLGLAEQASDNKTISIDATYLKARHTASSLRLKKERSGRPVRFFITSGERLYWRGCPNEWPARGRLVACRQGI